MTYPKIKLQLTLWLCIIQILLSSAWAKTDYTIGILAFRPAPIVIQQWQPLLDELTLKIPDAQFHLVPYNYADLENAVKHNRIDFVLTNSANYIYLQHFNPKLFPLASLINQYQNKPLFGFGGVIAVKSTSPIRTLSDLKNKRIAAPNKHSLGGYLMQAYELQKLGISTSDFQLMALGMPHDKSIMALLKGDADAAFVRTGLIEQLIASGEVSSGSLRVLTKTNTEDFPQQISTDLYPEWPFVAMPHVNEQISARVAGVLLSIPYHSNLTQALGIYGFKIPNDYQSVRQVLQTLRAEPYDQYPVFTLKDIWHKYQAQGLLIISFSSVIFTLLILLFITYRKLFKTHQQLQHNAEELQIAALSFNCYQPTLITNAKKEIIKINKAFSDTFRYNESEVLGKNPSTLASKEHDKDFYKEIWRSVEQQGFWRGEIWDRKKTGEVFPVSTIITAIKNKQGELTHYHAAYLDITNDKALENHYKNMALTDPLTGLANRTLLSDRLNHAIARAKRRNTYYALVFLDLDNFKLLNDSHGHHIGDLLLKEMAKRLTQSIRDVDTVARLGGDEFVLLLESLPLIQLEAQKTVAGIVEKVQQAILKPYVLEGIGYQATASIGVTVFGKQTHNQTDLIKEADLAMYQAKQMGKNTIVFYQKDSH